MTSSRHLPTSRDVTHLYDLLGVLRLSGTGLSGDQDGLAHTLIQHRAVGVVGRRKDVGRGLPSALAAVQIDDLGLVDGQPLVRVDDD